MSFIIKSNIGKQPLSLTNATVFLDLESNSFYLKGRLGVFNVFPSELFILNINVVQNQLKIIPKNSETSPFIGSLWGTYRSLISNTLVGVQMGFVQNLELVGLGFKASIQGTELKLKIGKSHEVLYKVPTNLNVKFFTNTLMSIRGLDLQQVRHVAYQIYKLKKPDVYKNKGIRIPELALIKKEGKKQK